jgi:hypothetical protein
MNIVRFFDKLEDKIRGSLSHYPILYALIGGVGIVLFWRGIWHTMDAVSFYVLQTDGMSTVDFPSLIDGLVSLGLGTLLLLPTGLFVVNFIGSGIIVSGLKGEKKIEEKTEKEIRSEAETLTEIKDELRDISDKLDRG